MGSTAATVLLLGFLVPTLAVFVISYRRALRTWLAPHGANLPMATIAGQRTLTDGASLARRFHAAVIATAFASVFTMALIAVALIAMLAVYAVV